MALHKPKEPSSSCHLSQQKYGSTNILGRPKAPRAKLLEQIASDANDSAMGQTH